jgi:hypothetical protein
MVRLDSARMRYERNTGLEMQNGSYRLARLVFKDIDKTTYKEAASKLIDFREQHTLRPHVVM